MKARLRRQEALRKMAEVQKLKLTDLRPGDIVQGFESWCCVPHFAKRTVQKAKDGTLFLRCSDGTHLLDGQEDDNGILVGMSKARNAP